MKLPALRCGLVSGDRIAERRRKGKSKKGKVKRQWGRIERKRGNISFKPVAYVFFSSQINPIFSL